MKSTVRMAWMAAGTLLLTRILVAIIDGVLWYSVQTIFWVPRTTKSLGPERDVLTH